MSRRLYEVLNLVAATIVKDVTPSSISSFIAVNSGYTVADLVVKKCGKVLAINFLVSRNTATGADITMNIGTIASQYRPVINSGGASASFREIVATDGTVYARPATQVAAGSQEAFTIMYLTS